MALGSRPRGRLPVKAPAGRVLIVLVADHEEYVEQVLALVEQVPAGRVTSYGLVAEVVGRGGPRQVGSVLAREGGGVPWWRVVRADGSLPPSHLVEARARYLEEGTPLRPSGSVDMARAFWQPPTWSGTLGTVQGPEGVLDVPEYRVSGGGTGSAGPARPGPPGTPPPAG